MNKLSPEMPELQSMNITADNITKLKSLFPEAFNEDSVDFEVLKQLLGENVDDKEERYGLNWHGKRQARQLALTPSRGTLRPCKDESVDWDNTKNLMIEGDNLEVLKLLQKSYAGKVKLIYIDPPYNTGKDFVYPDNFQDNIKNYLEVWKASQEKASVFADTWQRVVWKNPQLDYSINHPTSAMGLNVVNRGKLEAKNTNMRALAKQHGIIFFFRSDCPYCHAVSKVLKTMENEFGMEVIAASLDGGGLPEYPVYKDGRNLAGKWEVQVVPALFLANKQTTEYAPIGFGAMALDEIVDRIYSLTNVPVGTGF